MNRRTFLWGLTLGTLVAPLAGEAQQAVKVYRVSLRSRATLRAGSNACLNSPQR
jgi:hypothetical protein